MDWSKVASVELPQGTQIGDLLGVVTQLEAQIAATAAQPRPEGAPPRDAIDSTVLESMAELVTARDALREKELKRGGEPPRPERAEEVNVEADDAWRSLERGLDGKRVLPDDETPGRVEANALHARLFSGGREGLRFVNARPRRQWESANVLMKIVEEPAVAKTLDGLGLGRELRAVVRTHREFGLAFGFLKAQDVRPETITGTRPEQLALQECLRDYLIKVTARVSKRDPSSATAARYLLQPYFDMVEDIERSPKNKKPGPTPPAVPTNPS